MSIYRYFKATYLCLGLLVLVVTGPVLVPLRLHVDPAIQFLLETPDATPISGWYGPGAWIAYVLTSLSALYHFAQALRRSDCSHNVQASTAAPESTHKACEVCPRDEWDTDLLVSLVYTAFSAADLIKRSISVIANPEKVERKDVPAMQAAAIATYVGFGIAQVGVSVTFLAWRRSAEPRWQVLRENCRRLIVLGVLLIASYLGLAICERAKGILDGHYRENRRWIGSEFADDLPQYRDQIAAVVDKFDSLWKLPSDGPDSERLQVFKSRILEVSPSNGLPTRSMEFSSMYLLGLSGASFLNNNHCGKDMLKYLISLKPDRSFRALFTQTFLALYFYETIANVARSKPVYKLSFLKLNRMEVFKAVAFFGPSWVLSNTNIDQVWSSVWMPALASTVMGWPALWLMLTPGSGFFPYTGISLTELDQMGALVTVLVVFGVRLTALLAKGAVKKVQKARERQKLSTPNLHPEIKSRNDDTSSNQIHVSGLHVSSEVPSLATDELRHTMAKNYDMIRSRGRHHPTHGRELAHVPGRSVNDDETQVEAIPSVCHTPSATSEPSDEEWRDTLGQKYEIIKSRNIRIVARGQRFVRMPFGNDVVGQDQAGVALPR